MSPGQTEEFQLAPHHALHLGQLEPELGEWGLRRPGLTVRCSAVLAVPICTALQDFGMFRDSVAERRTSVVAADMRGNMSAVEDVFVVG